MFSIGVVVGGSRRVSRKSHPCKLPFDLVHFDRTRTGIPIGQMEQRQCCSWVWKGFRVSGLGTRV